MGTNVLIQGAGGGGVKLAPLNNPASASEVLNGKELYDDTGTKITGSYSATLPTLNAPTISVSGDQITITNPATNGNFVLQYYIFLNGLPHSIIMADHNTYTFTGLADGTYYVKVRCRGTNFNDSADSNIETMTISTSSPIYGVSGLYDSTTALTRTDAAVGMTYSISSGEVSSDFDSVFPWDEATVETINGNKFLHLPDMWFRIGKDSSNRITDVAVSKEQGATGNWYKVDSFYYACYGGSMSGGKLASVSGVARQDSAIRDDFRTLASANGSGYHQLDLYHKTVMQFLWYIEWANKDSQSIMRGRDATYGSKRVNTGGTDSLSTPSGFNTSTGQMRWHYIEDYLGNLMEFVDGATGASGSSTYYVTADPSKFNDTGTGMNTLAYTYPSNASSSNRCVSALGWDDNNPFLVLPKEQTGTDYTIHFCDSNQASNNVVLYCGAWYNSSDANYGVCYFNWRERLFAGTVGGRLLYKPIA